MSEKVAEALWRARYDAKVRSSSDSKVALVAQIAVLAVSLATLAVVKMHA